MAAPGSLILAANILAYPMGPSSMPPAYQKMPPVARNEQYLVSHLINRFNNHVKEGYGAFLENEVLCDTEITGMSKLSEYLLSHINYEEVIEKRYTNYNYLHAIFTEQHLFPPEPGDDCVPMVYPIFLLKPPNRKLLADNDIFIPTYWRDVLDRKQPGFEIERLLTQHLLPLPIDHRYNLQHMERIVKLIKHIQ